MGVLIHVWKGLVPPNWREVALRPSFCPEAYLLAVFFFLSAFYLGPRLLKEWRDLFSARQIVGMAFVGLLIAAASPTTFSVAEGRWGGYFWAVVLEMPDLGQRSLFFLVLTPLGLGALLWLWRLVSFTRGSAAANVWLISIGSWAGSFLVNRQVFHRYFEPMILVFLITGVALGTRKQFAPAQRMTLACLFELQLAVTAGTAWLRIFGK